MSDKLMSRDSVKTFILVNENRFGAEIAINFARQLYDTMGELDRIVRQNELYKVALLDIANGTTFPAKVAISALENLFNEGLSNVR